MLEQAKARARESAQREARQQADLLKDEVGRMAFDVLEEYYPEEAKSRRRRQRLQTLIVGVGLGILLRHLLGTKRSGE